MCLLQVVYQQDHGLQYMSSSGSPPTGPWVRTFLQGRALLKKLAGDGEFSVETADQVDSCLWELPFIQTSGLGELPKNEYLILVYEQFNLS